MIFSNFTDIGGIVINITIVITSETCIDGKYNQSLLLEKFKELVTLCTYNLDKLLITVVSECWLLQVRD